MSEADRRALAHRQGALVEALSGAAGVPEGLDERRLSLAARSLHAKRARGVEKTWPALREELGPGFGQAFARYARETPLPAGGAAEDGAHFAEWLLHERTLGDAGTRQLLLWRARRGWPVRVMRLPGARIALAFRLRRVWSIDVPAWFPRGAGPPK